MPFNNPIISFAGPLEKGLEAYDEDNTTTIKWVSAT